MIKNGLLEIVKERPDPSLTMDNIMCPHCESEDVKNTGHSQTLVGSIDGYDPNHHWYDYVCKTCDEYFMLERKDGNIWYTAGRFGSKIFKGMPTCFESYIYTCVHCDGDVHRVTKELDGVTLNTSEWTSYDDGRPLFRTFFECQSCEASVESINEHYCKPIPTKELLDRFWKKLEKDFQDPTKMRLGWTIIEEPGITIINDESVMKLEKGDDNGTDND